MAVESKYSFHKSPIFDNVIELVKDGRVTICPKGQMGMTPHPTIQNQVIMMRPACNNSCPFFQCVMLKKKDSEESQIGYVLQCVDKPLPIFVDESPLKKMEILK